MLEQAMARYNQWVTQPFFDEDTKAELLALQKNGMVDEQELLARFGGELAFGTGGLRGIMGAGTNRMNRYTVGRASLGLAAYLQAATAGVAKAAGIVVGYDTRHNSAAFARCAANVFTAGGFRVYLFAMPVPTPQVSFAVRRLGAAAGVVLTASHNPKEYNGYKVYNSEGIQLLPAEAEQVTAHIRAVPGYRQAAQGNDSLLCHLGDETTDAFCNAVLKQARLEDGAAKNNLSVVYTPLHGAGLAAVTRALRLGGFGRVQVVPRQQEPDGDFPTVESPNPEEKGALAMGIALAEGAKADIVLGTDPDADRVGVAVNTGEGFALLTGNQIGGLLVDYILQQSPKQAENGAIVKTVVTSELGASIARAHGLAVFDTLTGFKYIGSLATRMERRELGGVHFVLGYEESFGYLVGTHARDKDAVVASLLICEMAAFHKSRGKTLVQRLEELYARYGYYLDVLDAFTLNQAAGAESVGQIMARLRGEDGLFANVEKRIDYLEGVDGLPKADVLKFLFAGGSWLAVRPSGTEPKMKAYYSIVGANRGACGEVLNTLRQRVGEIVRGGAMPGVRREP